MFNIFYWRFLRCKCEYCKIDLILHGYMGGVWVCPKCGFYD